MVQNDSKKFQTNIDNYHCEKCGYNTCKKSSWNKHLQTKKHKDTLVPQKISPKWKCKCGKIFKYHSGFYRHKKKCAMNEKKIYKSGFEEGVKATTDILGKLKEQGLMSVSINGDNNVINNQKIFNINLFLNENCANAMSIQDFAEKLKLTMDDLYKNKKDCISNIVLKNVNPLPFNNRPFHCADFKNKEWYIKDQKRGWEEDNGEKVLNSTEIAINKKWPDHFQKNHPNWKNNPDQQNKFLKLAKNSTISLNNSDKHIILDSLSKKTMIDKIKE